MIKYEISTDGCWICTHPKATKYPYPFVRKNGKNVRIHRHIYEKEKGQIPAGMVVRHTCDNTKCINPDHLVIGTQTDNMRDMIERRRFRPSLGEQHGMSKLTENAVYYILMTYRVGRANELAELFSVKPKAIRRIAQNRSWKHIDRSDIIQYIW